MQIARICLIHEEEREERISLSLGRGNLLLGPQIVQAALDS